MGYMHIENLYKKIDEFTNLDECYVSEKIHGTSANITWDGSNIKFYSGGSEYESFVRIFDKEKLISLFSIESPGIKTTIYGEAYGGKLQRMSDTYGKELKFIVFDVKVNNRFVDTPEASAIADMFDLEFVPYHKVSCDIETLTKYMEAPSEQAVRNNCGENKEREGIVIRPLTERLGDDGKRLIAKFKSDKFRETRTKRKLDNSQLKVLTDARDIASEWVTKERLNHVLDKLQIELTIKDTSEVARSMIEDVRREAEGEIVFSKLVMKEIGRRAARLYKSYLKEDNLSGGLT